MSLRTPDVKESGRRCGGAGFSLRVETHLDPAADGVHLRYVGSTQVPEQSKNAARLQEF